MQTPDSPDLGVIDTSDDEVEEQQSPPESGAGEPTDKEERAEDHEESEIDDEERARWEAEGIFVVEKILEHEYRKDVRPSVFAGNAVYQSLIAFRGHYCCTSNGKDTTTRKIRGSLRVTCCKPFHAKPDCP